MNPSLKRLVVTEYPYPITVDFMRLNTPEYKEKDTKRLAKICEVTETIIHFLALVSISDLLDNYMKKKSEISNTFRERFVNNFTKTSMGKWGELLREVIKQFKANNCQMFLCELADYFVEGDSGESKAQKAFNYVTTLRNKIIHKDRQYSKAEIAEFCDESEKKLELLLEELSFITEYQLLYVNKITVKYRRWSDPNYDIDLSNIIGSNPELFDIQTEHTNNLMHTPAVIITKEGTKEYLNLEPLIIYSDEGTNRIYDIFMYIDFDKGKTIKYKPILNGGAFDSVTGSNMENLTDEVLVFFREFSAEGSFN